MSELGLVLPMARSLAPAIVMSGHLDRDREGVPHVDATLLSKPFRPSTLVSSVREAVGRNRPVPGA